MAEEGAPLGIARVATEEADVDMYGTSLQGHIDATYDDLVKALGPPVFGPDGPPGKDATCEFRLELTDGSVWTLYDRHTYGPTPRSVYPWHVGGSKPGVEAVAAALGLEDWRDSFGRLRGIGRDWIEQQQQARRPKRARKAAPKAVGPPAKRAAKAQAAAPLEVVEEDTAALPEQKQPEAAAAE